MALTPEQLNNAANYFAGQAAAINHTIAHPTPLGSAPSSSARRGGGGGQDNIQRFQQSVFGTSNSNADEKLAGFFNPVGVTVGNQILAPQGKDLAPTNFTQWLMNLLSTPLYASSRFAQGLGKAASDNNTADPKTGAAQKLQNDPVGFLRDSIGEGFAQSFGGLARGVAEGFGARFDNQRPRTMGQNFEDIGLTKLVEDAAGGLGATSTGSHFFDNKKTYGGILGTAGDIFLDPSTYVGGVGALKGLRAGVAAAGDATRAGEGLVGSLKAGAVGVSQGVADAAAAKAANAALKAQRAALIKGNQNAFVKAGGTAEDFAAAHSTITPVAEAAVQNVIAKKGGQAPAGADLLPVPETITPTAPKALNFAARAAAVDELLPRLSAASTRDVPAGAILRDSAVPVGKGAANVAPEVASKISAVMTQPAKIPDLTAGLKALKADPQVAPLLKETVTAGGKTFTLGQAIERVATQRITGVAAGSSGELHAAGLAELQKAVTDHLGAGAPAPLRATPASLSDAIVRNMPGVDPNAPRAGAPSIMEELATRMRQARSMDERKQALTDALGVQTRGFPTFDSAMIAAASGSIGAEQMREMLKALGIRSKLTDPAALQKSLTSRGAQRWEEIQAAVRSPREVLSDHGVDPTIDTAAKLVNAVRAGQEARAAYLQTVHDLGYDPAAITPPRYNPDGTPNAGAGVGNAIHHAVAKLGELFKGKQLTEAYGRAAMLDVHRAVIGTIKLRGAGLTAQQRADNFINDYLTATKATEDYARSLGQVPYLPNGRGRTPFYVSFGQVATHLPRQTLVDSLFAPLKYSLGHTAGDTAFKAGLSIYPSTITVGARTSMQALVGGHAGQDAADVIRAAMEAEAGGAKNAFQASAEGQRALDELAHSMAQPAFQAAMKDLHDRQQLIAVALAQKTAEGLVMPIGARIANALGAGEDRSAITAAIRDGYKSVEDATQGLDGAPTLAHELATQRLDNALVNGVLGQWGHALARFDTRAGEAAATAVKTGQKVPRGTATENVRTLLADSDEQVGASVGDRIASGELEDTASEHLSTVAEMRMQLASQGLWGKLQSGLNRVGVGVEGEYGQGVAFPYRTGTENAIQSLDHDYHQQMSNWLLGTSQTPGVLQRLGADLGISGRASIKQANLAMGTWWKALAHHVTQTPGLPDGALHDALLRDVAVNAKLGIHDAVPGLSSAQADMAMELYRHLNKVFSPEMGPLQRLGLEAEHVNPHLMRYGMADYMFNEGLPLAAQTAHWAGFVPAEPLNTLNGFRNAMTSAAQRPAIMAALAHDWGHEALGMTRKEAYAQGWRAIDSRGPDAGSLAQHAPAGVLFSPSVRKDMAYVQNYLDTLDKNMPALWSKVFFPVDTLTSIIKPSMTIWRTGHHISNMSSLALFTLMKGYNPLKVMRTFSTLKALGHKEMAAFDAEHGFTTAEAAWMANVQGKVPGFVGPLNQDALKQGVTFTSKKEGVIHLSPEDLAAQALRSGLVRTGHNAMDLASERELNSVGGVLSRIGSSKYNLIARANRALGTGTALYENAFQLNVMMQVLESKRWDSLSQAMTEATKEALAVNPGRTTLSVFDRKVTNHVVLFHSWIRGALGQVARTAIDHPKYVTIPSDWQYNQAEANGLQPESLGKPFSNDPRIPSYYSQGLLGPTWTGGLSPFGGLGDLQSNVNAAGQPQSTEPNLWGLSLSAPQIDALTNYLGGLNFGGDPLQNARMLASGLNPAFLAPAELIANKPFGIATNKPISADYAGFLLQQTGYPSSVANAFGITGTHPTWTAAENQGDVARKLFNFIAGLKVIDYTNPTASKIGTSEQGVQLKAELAQMGYTPAQIKAMQAYYKQMQQQDAATRYRP